MSEIVEVNIPVLSGADTGCTNCGSCGGLRARVEEIQVTPGDWVEEDAVLVTLETNKALLDVQAPCCGEVVAVLVENGESVEDGQLFLLIEAP